jgi:hypothetical protein
MDMHRGAIVSLYIPRSWGAGVLRWLRWPLRDGMGVRCSADMTRLLSMVGAINTSVDSWSNESGLKVARYTPVAAARCEEAHARKTRSAGQHSEAGMRALTGCLDTTNGYASWRNCVPVYTKILGCWGAAMAPVAFRDEGGTHFTCRFGAEIPAQLAARVERETKPNRAMACRRGTQVLGRGGQGLGTKRRVKLTS